MLSEQEYQTRVELQQYKHIIIIYGLTILTCFLGFLYPIVFWKSLKTSKLQNKYLRWYLFLPNLIGIFVLFTHSALLTLFLLATPTADLFQLIISIYKVNILICILACFLFYFISYSSYSLQRTIALQPYKKKRS